MNAQSPLAFLPCLLGGVRVLDASRVLAGPFCGQMLGDLGAEVIKIERPDGGDETREWGPPFHPTGPTAYYLSCNRNKRGLALNLGQPEGRALFHRLAQSSDVVLENFRAESAEKLGLAPRQLLEVNPRLVVCSISGFGRTGPLRDLPGYDFAIQAMSGLMSITGPADGSPYKVGVAVTDVLTGLYALSAILACLIARGKSGHGYAIDLALLDCAIASQVNVVQAYLSRLAAGHPPEAAVAGRQGNAHLQIVPYLLCATADGWIVLAVGNDGQWARFTRGAAPHLADPRFATNPERVRLRAELIPQVEAVLRTRTTQEWQAILEACGVPHAPLWTYAELFAHPHIAARGLKVTVTDAQGRPVELVGAPFHIGGRSDSGTGGDFTPVEQPTKMPPTLGQHTNEVLRELCGVSEEDLERLRQSGAIG